LPPIQTSRWRIVAASFEFLYKIFYLFIAINFLGKHVFRTAYCTVKFYIFWDYKFLFFCILTGDNSHLTSQKNVAVQFHLFFTTNIETGNCKTLKACMEGNNYTTVANGVLYTRIERKKEILTDKKAPVFRICKLTLNLPKPVDTNHWI
jgi:hypothetical protein